MRVQAIICFHFQQFEPAIDIILLRRNFASPTIEGRAESSTSHAPNHLCTRLSLSDPQSLVHMCRLSDSHSSERETVSSKSQTCDQHENTCQIKLRIIARITISATPSFCLSISHYPSGASTRANLANRALNRQTKLTSARTEQHA